MASIDNPQTWPPYESTRDCSQGFCSPYCPQWCYIVFPPPPPLGFPLDDSSDPNFSPLVIAIIGILASAFLLVSYYTVVSKYCGNFDSLRRRAHGDSGQEQDGTRTPAGQEAWQIAPTGLDESLIRTITVCKYKKGEGLVEGTDCSVCLNEFQDEESLRLLPKCSHAFHVSCIDTWLKSHSNCPLCRAHIVSPTPLPLQLPPLAEQETSPDQRPLTDSQRDDDSVVAVASEDLETSREELNFGNGGAESKPPVRALSNLEGRYHIVEIREEAIQPIRRSISLDYSRESPLSIADVLEMSMEDELDAKDLWFAGGSSAESSKRSGVEESKGNSRSRVLHSVSSPVAMKRCSSSGRFLFTRQGRGRNSVLPL